MLNLMQGERTEQSYGDRQDAKDNLPKVKRLRSYQTANEKNVEKIWEQLSAHTSISSDEKKELADPLSIERAETFSANIENYIGTVKVPLGVVGPIRIHGTHANGDYFAPLATTEAALVASYARGASYVALLLFSQISWNLGSS